MLMYHGSPYGGLAEIQDYQGQIMFLSPSRYVAAEYKKVLLGSGRQPSNFNLPPTPTVYLVETLFNPSTILDTRQPEHLAVYQTLIKNYNKTITDPDDFLNSQLIWTPSSPGSDWEISGKFPGFGQVVALKKLLEKTGFRAAWISEGGSQGVSLACFYPQEDLQIVGTVKLRRNPIDLDPETINYWSNYSKNKNFKTPSEAQHWLFETLEYFDRRNLGIFPINGSKANKRTARQMPLYRQGQKFKIGQRIYKPRWDWSQIEIKPAKLWPLEEAGLVNPFDNPRLGPIQLVPIKQIHMTESHSLTPEGKQHVEQLVEEIKEKGYFRAIIIDVSGAIVDGHHRFGAAKQLRQKNIPAQILTTDQDML